jgi:hypothetical protein
VTGGYESTTDSEIVDVSIVCLAYVTNGSLVLFAGVLFLVAFFRRWFLELRNATPEEAQGQLDDVGEDQTSSADPLKGNKRETESPVQQTTPVGQQQALRDKYAESFSIQLAIISKIVSGTSVFQAFGYEIHYI